MSTHSATEGKITRHVTYNNVRISRSADAVRDHDARATDTQAADGLRHKLLAANIKRGGGLIQQQQRRVPQKRARYDKALPLADAEVAERCTHLRFKPLR